MASRMMTRSSSASTLSCITVCNNSYDPSTARSTITPATENTEDASSMVTDATMKPEADDTWYDALTDIEPTPRALDRIRSLEHRAAAEAPQTSSEGGSRTVSGATLVNCDDVPREHLIQEIITCSESIGKVDAMPVDEKENTEPAEGTKTRRSTRLKLMEKATSIVKTTTTALGKRGREVITAGKEKLQAIRVDRRTTLRPRASRVQEEKINESPVKKRVRVADNRLIKTDTVTSTSSRPEVQKPKVKRWLTQGLYVGQERDFDPRLTDTKNKLKKQNSKSPEKRKENKVLPLPMFAGQRLLDTGRDFKLPFEVFSPLPPGQPKPEEWKKTQKNVFIGEAASIWKKTKLREHSTCICKPKNGCDEDCYNRLMFYECDDNNCSIGAEACTNRSFEDLKKRCKAGGKYNIGVEVIKTADRGYGVRSNRTFEPNQIIVEYTGEIITQEECENRMNTRYKDNECYYLMLFDQNMIIDATRGSIARFVNHSCAPNCRMTKWTVAGKPRMALFAGDEGILTGEELTYDYNFDPFSVKNVQQCRCGAPTCRGVLGPRPREHRGGKELRALVGPIIGGAKRKLREALDDGPGGEPKRRKVAAAVPRAGRKGGR